MTFDDYYHYIYLPVHTQFMTRLCHLIGNLATVAWVVAVLATSMSLWWLLLTPFVVYPFAIPSHYLFEKMPPALFSGSPLKAKYSDVRMCYEWVTGKL